MYTYDANGNRATKTTAYGTITYSYDEENRLLKTCGVSGDGVEYRYDSNGNVLSQTGSLTQSVYEYNHQNRMVRSLVIDDEAKTIASARYGYDPLGRRALVQDNNAATLRTLYDGLGFDVVKESPVYSSGGFTNTYNTGIQYTPAGRATGERYRYLDDGTTGEKYRHIEDNEYETVSSRYAGERAMLYAHGAPVAVNRGSGSRGYLGTDIMGSTRSVTDSHGVQEGYYDYDVFGNPVTGDFTTGVDYGYLGKSYDSRTGLYNYGYRDYNPQTVRFTTVDPIRDGTNWFAYVNNDPVNYVDLWGLFTFQVGVSAAGGAGTGGTIGSGFIVAWDSEEKTFEIGTYETYGMGSHIGVSGAVSIDFSTSENRAAADAGGKGIAAGIGATITPASVSYNLTESLEGGKPVTTVSIGLGGGLTSNDVHTYYTETKVHTVKIGVGGFINKVKDFGKNLADRIMGKAGKYD